MAQRGYPACQESDDHGRNALTTLFLPSVPVSTLTARTPVSSAGHADIVEDGKGNWWAVFLACRPYEEDMYNTGRDTYLLPVTWKNGWPEILAKNTPISSVGEKAGLKPAERMSSQATSLMWITSMQITIR